MSDSELEVIEIVPNGRYAIVIKEEFVPRELIERMRDNVKQWQESGEQFLFLYGVELVRVDGDV
jgi:hypothetical protein